MNFIKLLFIFIHNDTMGTFAFLTLTVAFIYFLASLKPLKGFFHFLPPVIWCYFLPMLATTMGLIPDHSPLYSWLTKYLLPFALILLLLSTDLKAIFRLGPRAIIVMLFGSFGIILGASISFYLFKNHLFAGKPALMKDVWKGVGALSGSWIGGSANMTAIAAGVGLDKNSAVLTPFLAVDTIVGYGWMGIVIFLARFQDSFNKFFKIDTSAIDKLNIRLEKLEASKTSRKIEIKDMAYLIGIAMSFGIFCKYLGYGFQDIFKTFWTSVFGTIKPNMNFFQKFIVNFGSVFGGMTWAIIFATIVGIILSFTPFKKMEEVGASNIGYFALFLVLTGYGARANLSGVSDIYYFFFMGIVWIIIHAICLFIGLLITRSPLFFFAVGSQANIGGPTTASIVAGVYQKSLAPVGVLLGVFGSIIGTPLGLIVASIAKVISGQ